MAIEQQEQSTTATLPRSYSDLAGAAFGWLKLITAPSNIEELVRGSMTLMLFGAYLYLQWQSPKDGAVPAALVSLASGTAGYYLSQNGSRPRMQAVISLLVIGVTAAFYLKFQWLSDSLNTLASAAIGHYFGKASAAKPAATTEVKP